MQVSYPQVGQERQFKTDQYYLVTFELPCKFRTHNLDKKDSSKQKRLFSDPGTPMQVSYPQVGQERQFKTDQYYLVTFELPCKFRTHKLDKKDSSKQKRLFSDPGTRMQVSYPHVRQEIQFKTEEYYYEYELSVRKGVQLTLAFLDYR